MLSFVRGLTRYTPRLRAETGVKTMTKREDGGGTRLLGALS
jgi:hypothetical protein